MSHKSINAQSDKTVLVVQMLPYLVGGVLLLLLVFGPVKDPVNVYDEGVVLVGATEIMGGKIPYRDFWANYAPGQFYTLAVLFRIFGTNVMVERIYDRLIIIGLAAVIYSVEIMVIPPSCALIVTIISAVFLSTTGFFGYPVFAALFSSIVALKCLLKFITEKRRYLVFLAGVFVGVTALFRHDFGAYAGGAFAATLIVCAPNQTRHRCRIPSSIGRDLLLLVTGALVVFLPLLLYFAISGALRPLWRDLFVFNLTVFPPGRRLSPPGIVPTLTRHGLFAWLTFWGCVSALGLSLIVVVDIIWSAANERAVLNIKEVGLVASSLFGLLLLAQATSRFDWIHLLPSFSLGVLAGAGILCNSRFRSSTRLRVLIAASLITIAFPGMVFLALINIASFRPPWRCYSHLARAACIAIEPDDERAIDYILAHTRSDEYIFVGNQRHDFLFSNDVIFYFLAGRPIPVGYYWLDPGAAPVPVQQAIVNDLRSKDVRMVILVERAKTTEPNGSSFSRVRILDDFIRGAYTQVACFGRYQIWHRR
jgi:hypothetical protein